MSCKFCEIRKYDPNNYGKNNINVLLGKGEYSACYIGIALPNKNDKLNHLAIWGEGDDETSYYYPRYCPECGRKINENEEIKGE